MKHILLIALALISLMGCKPATVADNGSGEIGSNRTASDADQDRDDDFDHEENNRIIAERDKKYRESFSNIEGIFSLLPRNVQPKLFEGLPHQHFRTEEMHAELVGKECVMRQRHFFYKSQPELDESDAARLLELLGSPSTYEIYSGFKGCGGFHPDFALVWQDSETEIEFQLCFGCGDAKIYGGENWVFCQIKKAAREELKSILGKYHRQLPD